MLLTIGLSGVVVLALLVWLGIIGVRMLRTFVRSFWPH